MLQPGGIVLISRRRLLGGAENYGQRCAPPNMKNEFLPPRPSAVSQICKSGVSTVFSPASALSRPRGWGIYFISQNKISYFIFHIGRGPFGMSHGSL